MLKKIPIYLFIILFIFLITRNRCNNSIAGILGVRNVTINTWDGWKDQLRGIDHFEKYGAISIGYNEDSIRFDFVEKFDEIFSSEIFQNVFQTSPINDSLYNELKRTKIIGVWQDDKILHMSDHLTYTNILTDDYLDQWSHSTKWMLDSTIHKNIDGRIDNKTYLVITTISSLFTKLVLHGGNGRIVSIDLPYYFGNNK